MKRSVLYTGDIYIDMRPNHTAHRSFESFCCLCLAIHNVFTTIPTDVLGNFFELDNILHNPQSAHILTLCTWALHMHFYSVTLVAYYQIWLLFLFFFTKMSILIRPQLTLFYVFLFDSVIWKMYGEHFRYYISMWRMRREVDIWCAYVNCCISY